MDKESQISGYEKKIKEESKNKLCCWAETENINMNLLLLIHIERALCAEGLETMTLWYQ